ncbi:DUF302 domain-containing protein [Thermococcus peptonophilus]|uniref:DUF302 domain-containing protein n=1 Tax=Thermococcus peptonophilus TaxID=53952 RepID=A0A142CX65_9EURY|nr:DUF302 domain-containing protein [Thermococcus peptonophilus]AMQ19367.1 hypothetical protein A0127_09445 [Thermococcus peptonophilus]
MEDMMKQMVKGVKSKYSFEETIKKMKEKVEGLGWKVIGEYDFKDKLGIGFAVLEVCNKDFAAKAVGKPENRWISAMMPCRFSVIEMPDGIYVFGMNMGLFSQMVSGELGELLKEVAKIDEEIMSAVL